MGEGIHPFAVFEDTWTTYIMGLVSWPYHYFVNRAKFHPYKRSLGMRRAALVNTPKTALIFGKWGAIYSFSDVMLACFRGIDDVWNSVVAGGITTAFMGGQVRRWGRNFKTGLLFFFNIGSCDGSS